MVAVVPGKLTPQLLTYLFKKGLSKSSCLIQESTSGVGNSFGLAGHFRDKLGIRGPVHVHLKVVFVIKQALS